MANKGEAMRTDCLRAKKVMEFTKSPARVKQVILSAGSTIGSVHFHKRKSGELRKMAYRLHVTNPSCAKKPTGKGNRDNIGTSARKTQDNKHNLLTVFDVNKVVRNSNGKQIGRGAWRMVPLENVIQVTVKGIRHVFDK